MILFYFIYINYYILLFFFIVMYIYVQDPKHRVRDLIDGRGPWLKLKSDKSSVQIADLQLEKATTIPYIDIGKYYCV